MITPVTEADFLNGTPAGYMLNPLNFILDSEKDVDGVLVQKFRAILHWKFNAACKIPKNSKPELIVHGLEDLGNFDEATVVDAKKCFYQIKLSEHEGVR